MAGYWLKLYTEILEDPKYNRMTDNTKIGMYELLLVAKRFGDDGSLPPIEDVAFYTRRSVEWWQVVYEELRSIEFLVSNGHDIIIRKFGERQAPVSDSERMIKSRAKKHRDEFSTDVLRNVTESVTNRNGDTDTEIDTDTEKESESGASAAPVDDKEDDCLSEFTEITGHRPRKAQHDAIIAVMSGIQRTDRVDYLRTYWQEWSVRGYNPYGLAWLTEWARDGTIPAQRKGVEAVVVDDAAQRYKYTRGKFAAWGEH